MGELIMTPSQWLQFFLTAAAVLVAAVVVREAVKQLRREVDDLTPKVSQHEKDHAAELAELNIKLAKLDGVPAGLIEVGQKVEGVDRKLARAQLRLENLGSLESRVRRMEETQQEIRLRLAERGVRTATPARGLPTTKPPPDEGEKE